MSRHVLVQGRFRLKKGDPTKTSIATTMQYSDEIIKSLSPEELDEFREAFMLFDKDGNGNISTKELGLLCKCVILT